jgi:hypothetical protein
MQDSKLLGTLLPSSPDFSLSFGHCERRRRTISRTTLTKSKTPPRGGVFMPGGARNWFSIH